MGNIARRVNEMDWRITEDALDDDGYVMTFGGASTAGNLKKTAAGQLTPYGVSYTSTKDPFTGTATASREVAVVRDGDAYVRLLTTAVTIVAGDLLGAVAGGFVDKLTVTDASSATLGRQAVGIALEGKNANPAAGSKILCELRLRGAV